MFLDVAIGILSAVIFDYYFNVDFKLIFFLAILFSLLPALDFVIYKVFKIEKDKVYKHRDLFHIPYSI